MLSTETFDPASLQRLRDELSHRPFVPPRLLSPGDLQTLGAYFWRGRFGAMDVSGDEARLFDVEPGTQVLGRCRWQPHRKEHPTVMMWHGIEGSSNSPYMLITADKAFRAGFNVVRMNTRNCGGTEHLTPTLYHGGMSSDARAVVEELIDRDGLKAIILVGFSLGGNSVLKLAGEYGDDVPEQVRGIGAISPSVSLGASVELLMSPRNWIYHQNFLYHLKRRIIVKEKLFPGQYDLSPLRKIRSMREFDSVYIAPPFGFADVNDYYTRASSLTRIAQIRIPTLIVHAQDDPFVPFAPLNEASVTDNPQVVLLAPERGGHVAFLSAESSDEDRFWGENRLIDFLRLLAAGVS
jgi:uncharacterized protein